MTEEKQSHFEGYAVVELMGRQVEIGYVTTEAYGAATLFRVETPAIEEGVYAMHAPGYIDHQWMPAGTAVKRPASPGKTRLVGAGSIYAINPCTEAAAIQAIIENNRSPLTLYGAAAQLSETMAIATAATDGPDDQEGEEDPFD